LYIFGILSNCSLFSIVGYLAFHGSQDTRKEESSKNHFFHPLQFWVEANLL